MPIAFAAKEAAELRDPAHGDVQGRRLSRGDGGFLVIDAQRLLLFFAEEDGAGHLGGFASELREVENAPGDLPVDGQAGLEAVGLA